MVLMVNKLIYARTYVYACVRTRVIINRSNKFSLYKTEELINCNAYTIQQLCNSLHACSIPLTIALRVKIVKGGKDKDSY